MEATNSGYRLRVRVGPAEFDAEGPQELVQAQFTQFLEALKGSAPEKPPVRETDFSETPRVNGALGGFQRELIERAFMDDGQRISLRVLPQGESVGADALVLLLFGFQEIKQQHDVSSIDLTSAARKSGLALDRIDRTIPSEFVNRGGRAKGTRYSLNNRGIARAQEMLEAMFT